MDPTKILSIVLAKDHQFGYEISDGNCFTSNSQVKGGRPPSVTPSMVAYDGSIDDDDSRTDHRASGQNEEFPGASDGLGGNTSDRFEDLSDSSLFRCLGGRFSGAVPRYPSDVQILNSDDEAVDNLAGLQSEVVEEKKAYRPTIIDGDRRYGRTRQTSILRETLNGFPVHHGLAGNNQIPNVPSLSAGSSTVDTESNAPDEEGLRRTTLAVQNTQADSSQQNTVNAHTTIISLLWPAQSYLVDVISEMRSELCSEILGTGAVVEQGTRAPTQLSRLSPAHATKSRYGGGKSSSCATSHPKDVPKDSSKLGGDPLAALPSHDSLESSMGISSSDTPTLNEDQRSEVDDLEDFDSEPDYASDYTLDVPYMDLNHPFMRHKARVVDELLRAYDSRSWITCRPSGSESFSEKITTPTSRQKTSESGGKRPRGGEKSHGPNGPPEEDNDNDNDNGNDKKRQCQSNTKRPRLACPFYKIAPMRYSKCSAMVISRICHLKTHLSRYHQLPVYCPRCKEIFDDEPERDTHTSLNTCPERPDIVHEGLTKKQKEKLGKQVSRNAPEEFQWFQVFDILFPGFQPRPKSAYINGALVAETENYQDFERIAGPSIIREALGRAGVSLITDNPEHDWNTFCDNVLADALTEVARRWHEARQQEPQQPGLHLTSSESSGNSGPDNSSAASSNSTTETGGSATSSSNAIMMGANSDNGTIDPRILALQRAIYEHPGNGEAESPSSLFHSTEDYPWAGKSG